MGKRDPRALCKDLGEVAKLFQSGTSATSSAVALATSGGVAVPDGKPSGDVTTPPEAPVLNTESRPMFTVECDDASEWHMDVDFDRFCYDSPAEFAGYVAGICDTGSIPCVVLEGNGTRVKFALRVVKHGVEMTAVDAHGHFAEMIPEGTTLFRYEVHAPTCAHPARMGMALMVYAIMDLMNR